MQESFQPALDLPLSFFHHNSQRTSINGRHMLLAQQRNSNQEFPLRRRNLIQQRMNRVCWSTGICQVIDSSGAVDYVRSACTDQPWEAGLACRLVVRVIHLIWLFHFIHLSAILSPIIFPLPPPYLHTPPPPQKNTETHHSLLFS